MFSQRHLKMVHGIVAVFITLCLLVTCYSLFSGEYRRIAQEREVTSALLHEAIELSVNAYEVELMEFVSLLNTKQDIEINDFNQMAKNFTTANQSSIEHVFFIPYQADAKGDLTTQEISLFASAYTFPNLVQLNNKAVIEDYYRKNTSSISKSKKATLSAPLAISATTSSLTSNNATELFLLSKTMHFWNDAESTDKNAVWGVVGISLRLGDLLNDLGFKEFNQALFRIADVSSNDAKQRIASDSIDFFYQSALAQEDAWDNANFHRSHMRIYGREWILDTRFNTTDFQLLNWGTVIVPFSLLLSISFLLYLYLLKVVNSYKRVLLSSSKQAEIDPLTRLHSRYFIYEKLAKSLRNLVGTQNKLLVICLDLDHFKTINDAFNHDVGDKMLAKVAQRLLSVVPDQAIVGRLGGDEFLVYFVLDSTFSQENIKSLCDEIITQISQSYFIDSRMLTVGCSIGLALYPECGTDAVTLVKNADMAMYKAKGAGRATYHFYDGSIGDQLARNAKVETRLRLAMLHNDLQIYFQPKVDLITLECVGLEALLRWEDKELGVVSPVEFIPIAEQSGIILPLGEWVIEQSCRQISQWQQNGLHVPPIAINCSAAQLRRHDFLPKLLNSLHHFDVSPPQIELEVTESILIEDPETCSNLLRQVSNLGMKITIDDFGTGYSSLSYLRDLPFDCIKIDQAFVRDIMEDESHAALTDAIIKMGQSLKLQVVAEGITTQEQLEYLRSLGCDIGQGFLFGEAFHADQLSNHAENIEQLLSKDT